MIFRLAKEDDLKAVFNLYKSVLNEENCVWNEYYPSILEIENDYKTNNLFVLEEKSEIIGAISIVFENEMDDFDEWNYKVNCGEFARVVIRQDKRGNNNSIIMISEIIKLLKIRNIDSIHIAVAKINKAALNIYKKIGFKIVGEKYMYNNHYYLCELLIGEGYGK